jgi:hypothetical protein
MSHMQKDIRPRIGRIDLFISFIRMRSGFPRGIFVVDDLMMAE